MPYQVFWAKCNVFDENGAATVLSRGEFVPDDVDAAQVSNLATIGAISFVDVSLSPRAELTVALASAPLESSGEVPDDDPDELPVDIVGGTVGPGTTAIDLPDEGGAEVGKPAKSDSKSAWVDYAVSQGASRDEAESSTKDDLIAAYGG